MTDTYRANDMRTPRAKSWPGPRLRRADVIHAAAIKARALRQPRAGASRERAAARLKRILTANPRARNFTVRRIVQALGDDPRDPVNVLFSAAGVFEATDIGYLSGMVTSAAGARMALRRRGVWLPRAVLRRKIPRQSLARVIHAVANVLEAAESRLEARWNWVFHPAMSVVLGLLIFLLALAGMTPILGMGAHAGAAFLISLGMAERDGLVVMIGALAGVTSLALAIGAVFRKDRLLHEAKDWLSRCFKRLGFSGAAWLLDRIEEGLGAVCRVRWSSALFILAADAMGRDEPLAGERGLLRKRVQRIRDVEHRKASGGKRI
jgi:hypothetical protein